MCLTVRQAQGTSLMRRSTLVLPRAPSHCVGQTYFSGSRCSLKCLAKMQLSILRIEMCGGSCQTAKAGYNIARLSSPTLHVNDGSHAHQLGSSRRTAHKSQLAHSATESCAVLASLELAPNNILNEDPMRKLLYKSQKDDTRLIPSYRARLSSLLKPLATRCHRTCLVLTACAYLKSPYDSIETMPPLLRPGSCGSAHSAGNGASVWQELP